MHSERCWQPDPRMKASSLGYDICSISTCAHLPRSGKTYMNKSAMTVSRSSLLEAGVMVSGVSNAMILAAPSR